MSAINSVIAVIQVIRACFIFSQCRISIARWFDFRRSCQLFSFAIWSLVGALGYLIRLQGPAILLNLFFNATVNAAYGLANTVSTQTANLSSSMVNALSPEITASEGRGDRARMLEYSLRACKFSTLLIMLFAVPLVMEMDYVLKIWLRDPPEYTTVFCQLMLIVCLMDYISIGHVIAVNAGGKIAAYQAVLGILNMLTIPLAWFFLKRGYAPTSVGAAIVIMCTISSIVRVLWAQHQFNMSVWRWVKEVVLACTAVATGAVLASGCFYWFLPSSFVRLMLVTATSITVIGILGWFIVLNSRERMFLTESTSKVIRKITGTKTVSYREQAAAPD
jgi:O-antigen/teichoic acid export membrane protein